jgi:hypothetical protein
MSENSPRGLIKSLPSSHRIKCNLFVKFSLQILSNELTAETHGRRGADEARVVISSDVGERSQGRQIEEWVQEAPNGHPCRDEQGDETVINQGNGPSKGWRRRAYSSDEPSHHLEIRVRRK